MPSSDPRDVARVRQLVVDWLDDNYHFGDAEARIGDDEHSFMQNGVLDSLGFVQLVLFLENRLGITIDRKELSVDNFDGLAKICRYVTGHPQFAGVS